MNKPEFTMLGPRVGVTEIVQILPNCATNPMFGGCLLVVTEVKTWGVMGYVQALGEDGKMGGQAYIRLPWDQVELTGGKAVWIPAEHANRVPEPQESDAGRKGPTD